MCSFRQDRRFFPCLSWCQDTHHTKPLQLDRCFDQTFNEHEFPLRYLDSLVTSKHLMEFMLFNCQTLSTCTDP